MFPFVRSRYQVRFNKDNSNFKRHLMESMMISDQAISNNGVYQEAL